MINIRKMWQWWIGINLLVILILITLIPLSSGLVIGYTIGCFFTFCSLATIIYTTKFITNNKPLFLLLTGIRLFVILGLLTGAILIIYFVNKSHNGQNFYEPINLFAFIYSLIVPVFAVILSNIKLKGG